MTTVILVIHVLITLALVAVILLQRSEGGALGIGGGGGMSGFMTGRATANVLTRATAILAALFFLTSIALAILATHRDKPRSIIDQPAGSAPAAPASTAPAPGAPAGSSEPAAPAPAAPSQPATPAAPQR